MRRLGGGTSVLLIVAASLVAAPAAAGGRRTATISSQGGSVNLRNGPSTAYNRVVGSVRHGARLSVRCQVYGQGVAGRLRRTGHWNRLSNGAYVSDAFVAWRPNRSVPWCSTRGVPTFATVYTRAASIAVRRGPGLGYAAVGRLANRRRFPVACQQWGQRVRGPAGTSAAWYVLATGRHVPAVWTRWRPGPPALLWCGQAPWTAPTTRSGFIRRVAPGAVASQRRYRVPASVTMAQAILESGWGRSLLTRRDHNYFGIKCFGGPGAIGIGCRSYATYECGRGRCWRTRASFRVYRSLSGSMLDHAKWLAERQRYRGAFRYYRSPNRFAVAIHRAGYATSPRYATNLIRVMRKYNLYRFNR